MGWWQIVFSLQSGISTRRINLLAFVKVASEAELEKSQNVLNTVRFDESECVDQLGN